MSKKIFFAVIVFLTMLFGACAPTPKATIGTPIDKAKVDLIVKNQTSAEEIVEMFGQPMNKVLVGEQEQWMYVYQDVNSKVGFTSIETSGRYQKLDVFIKDGVVVNYLHNDAPLPAMKGSGW
jgi:outer membrane protein assembly factor BamE (lipoprotein component of BamABCDE complex)